MAPVLLVAESATKVPEDQTELNMNFGGLIPVAPSAVDLHLLVAAGTAFIRKA